MVLIEWLVAILYAILFGVSGVSKLANPGSSSALLTFAIESSQARRAIVRSIAGIELCLAMLWLIHRPQSVAVVLTLCLLAAFTIVLVVNLLLGNIRSCGCFGSWSNSRLSYRQVLRNLFLAMIAGLYALVILSK